MALLLPLSQGLDITSDLIQVRKVMAGYQSQHHIQGLGATLIVLASALQICDAVSEIAITHVAFPRPKYE